MVGKGDAERGCEIAEQQSKASLPECYRSNENDSNCVRRSFIEFTTTERFYRRCSAFNPPPSTKIPTTPVNRPQRGSPEGPQELEAD